MTNAIEITKRVMYSWLAQVKMIDQGGAYQLNSATDLESALEAYLEALRQERDDLRNRLQAFEFANKSSDEFLIEAQELLRSERKVMAHLQAKVKSQRQSIGQLKNDRNNAQALAAVNYQKYQKARQELSDLRKSLMATPAQDSKENDKKEAYEAYQAGFNGVGTPSPHATGTLNHLHWMEGARAKMNFLQQNAGFGGSIYGQPS